MQLQTPLPSINVKKHSQHSLNRIPRSKNIIVLTLKIGHQRNFLNFLILTKFT
jgi:hypothetical protein